MASLRIPEPYKSGLARIASLDEKSSEELLEALKTVPPALYRKDVSARLAENVSSVQPDSIREVIEALFGLSIGRFSSDVSVSQFVDDIVEALSNDSESNLIGDANRNVLRQRLMQFLSVDTLKIGAKAYEVLFEHQRNFTTSRVLTDVRPVFSEKTEDRPVAAIIVHTLKVSYIEGGKRKEFFVALDTSDVQKLWETLERAKAKADNLKALIAGTGIPYVDAE